MALQEDDVMEREETSSVETASAQTAKADRNRAHYDAAAGTITVRTPEGETVETHSLAGIPDTIRAHLTLVGLHTIMQRSTDPAKVLAQMQAGQLPGRGPGKPKEINPWRLAYAHAKVEATKKTESALTLEQAKEIAEGLDKTSLRAIKNNPLVVKYYAKITGSGAELI